MVDLTGLVRQRPVVSEVVDVSPLRRDFDASRVNPVMNHPEVRPWAGDGGGADLDMTDLVANLRNVLLMTDHGGLLFVCLEPGTYEIHTQFLPGLQGAQKLAICREALHWMFTRTDCVGVVTQVPEANKAALGMVRAVKMTHEFDRDGMAYFTLRYWPWLWSDPHVMDRAHWFLGRVGKAPDNSAHETVLGAFVDQIFAGQIDKAIGLYNHWARISRMREISAPDVHSVSPLVIDLCDARVLFGRDDIEVIRCLLPQP